MWISRIEVREGFLDGLDVSFTNGLNVIIGARGTGKTSIIELIRFCLDAPALTEAARTRGSQQAISVLAGGRVTLTLTDGVDEVTMSRTADEPSEGPWARTPVIVLAQSEIEAVAASESGRLALLDRLLPDVAELGAHEARIATEVRSLTTEAAEVLKEGLQLAASLDALSAAPDALDQARLRQAELLQRIAATADDRNALAQLQSAGGQFAARLDVLGTARDTLLRWSTAVERLIASSDSILEPWPIAAGPTDALADVRTEIAQVGPVLGQLQALLSTATSTTDRLRAEVEGNRSALEERSRSIRMRLEALETGASQLTREVSALEEQSAQRDAVQSRINERRAMFRKVFDVRRRAYESLDAVRTARYQLRRAAADSLNEELMPSVRVTASSSQDTTEYTVTIMSGMRGSGMHYNNRAPLLAQRMAPIELVEAVELGDAAAIATATGIAIDRAAAIIETLRLAGVSEIIAAKPQDGVELELLDGKEYKGSEHLSIGQRCTIVLPILLATHSGTLLIDQPEDHLDNAFIASTLAEGLRKRGDAEQYIFT